MFTNNEVKIFLIKLGKKWFFPDFTNKLTWYVATLGAAFILVPQPIKLYVINWVIEILNLNSGLKLTLPDMESSLDYTAGVLLVFLALAHNIGYKYFDLKKQIFEHKVLQDRRISDYKLLETFLSEFSSSSPSAILLKEHDFNHSFDRNSLKQIEHFYNQWNGAEYKFIDEAIEEKREKFFEYCKSFLLKVAEYTAPVGASKLSSVIPDHLRANDLDLPEWVTNQIKELNELATEVYKNHQEFIRFAKTTIQS